MPRPRQAEGRPAARLAGGAARPAATPARPSCPASRTRAGSSRRSATTATSRMPPKGKLAAEQIAALTAWVKMGAPWPEAAGAPAPRPPVRASRSPTKDREFWSFQPGPRAGRAGGPRRALAADRRSTASSWRSWRRRACGPSPPADKRTLIRRATFDLIGLPPTPEEVEAFLADDSPDAFAKVVDRLLASPHYGERWAPALARRRPLRRGPGPHLPGPQVPRRLPLPRLGRQGVQRRPAVRPVRRRSRSPATCSTGRTAPTGWPRSGFFALGPVYYGDGATADELRRPRRHAHPRLPRADGRLRPLPRPQVRPDPDEGLLLAGRRLRQHRLQGVRADARTAAIDDKAVVRPDRQDGPGQEERTPPQAGRCTP